jgi:methylated-DNA-protein-cysteine methyltransferase related protein
MVTVEYTVPEQTVTIRNAREMARESEQAAFRQAVWRTVRRIPEGSVTTYGEIARSLGRPRNARLVGQVMRITPAELNLPCHRVVASSGELTGGWFFGHPAVMKGLLVDEGVPFRGEYVVDLRRCFWSPLDGAATDEMDDLDLIPGVENGGSEV